MKSIFSSHSKQIPTTKNKQVGCNCRVKNSCPLDSKCLTSQLIYQAEVTDNLDNEFMYYYDLQKQLSKNDVATRKALLKMKIVKTVRNFGNKFRH